MGNLQTKAVKHQRDGNDGDETNPGIQKRLKSEPLMKWYGVSETPNSTSIIDADGIVVEVDTSIYRDKEKGVGPRRSFALGTIDGRQFYYTKRTLWYVEDASTIIWDEKWDEECGPMERKLDMLNELLTHDCDTIDDFRNRLQLAETVGGSDVLTTHYKSNHYGPLFHRWVFNGGLARFVRFALKCHPTGEQINQASGITIFDKSVWDVIGSFIKLDFLTGKSTVFHAAVHGADDDELVGDLLKYEKYSPVLDVYGCTAIHSAIRSATISRVMFRRFLISDTDKLAGLLQTSENLGDLIIEGIGVYRTRGEPERAMRLIEYAGELRDVFGPQIMGSHPIEWKLSQTCMKVVSILKPLIEPYPRICIHCDLLVVDVDKEACNLFIPHWNELVGTGFLLAVQHTAELGTHVCFICSHGKTQVDRIWSASIDPDDPTKLYVKGNSRRVNFTVCSSQ